MGFAAAKSRLLPMPVALGNALKRDFGPWPTSHPVDGRTILVASQAHKAVAYFASGGWIFSGNKGAQGM